MINSATSSSLTGGASSSSSSSAPLFNAPSTNTLIFWVWAAVVIWLIWALFFDKQKSLPNKIMSLFDRGLKDTKLWKKGAGYLHLLKFWPALVLGGIILLIAVWGFEASFTSVLGVLVVSVVVISLVFNHPPIDPIWAYPKAYFSPSFESFLRAIAADFGMPNVEFRIDALEGFNAYAYSGFFQGRRLDYVIFWKALMDFVQEFDTPGVPDLQRRAVLAFVLCHELAHTHGDDTITKHHAISFVLPIAKMGQMLSNVRANIIASRSQGVTESRIFVGNAVLMSFSSAIAVIVAIVMVIYGIVMFPFAFLSRQMEFRADRKAFEYLSKSPLVRDQGISAVDGARFFFRHILESGLSVLRPSIFTSAMSSHPHPTDRGNALGVDVVAPYTERIKTN